MSAITLSAPRAIPKAQVDWQPLALLAGVIVLAATGMKTTASVPVHDRDGFLYKFDAAVRGLRYRPQTQSEGLLVYKPPAGQFLAEKITAELQPGGALVTAPRLLLRKIQEKLY
jgi:hypothetical protein